MLQGLAEDGGKSKSNSTIILATRYVFVTLGNRG